MEMKSLNGEQPPPKPPQTEPPAETPLTVPSSKTPQNEPPPETPLLESPSEPSQTEPQTENVPLKKAWYRKWKRAIISLAVVLLILVLIVSGVFLVSWLLDKPDKNEEFAAYYEKSLDQKILPCDNFYTFACTNLRREYAKENKDRFDTMAMMTKSTRHSLNDLLTKPLNTSDSAMLREMKIFHQACINTTKVEAEGIEPVLALLKKIGGWPLLSHDWKSTESWEDIVASINRVGFLSIFPFHLNPGLGLRLAPILDDQHPRVLPDGKRTEEYVKRVATLLNTTNEELDDDIKDCIVFESKLEEVAMSVLKKIKMSTLKNLTAEFLKISWNSFFRNVFVSTPIMEVSGNVSIYFTHGEYNSRIFELLNKTSPNTIRNYIVWRQIEQAIPLMPEEFREAKKVFEQRVVGQSRNLGCVDILIERAELSTGYIYIESIFDGSTKNTSRSIMKSVKSQADLFLNRIDWMDNDTQSRIIDTIKKLKMILPQANNSIDVMEKLEFQSNDTTFANYRRLASAHRESKYGRLNMSEEEDIEAVPMQYAMQADAYYSTAWNTMFILAAMVQRPVFSVDQPMYLNYGGIGFIMAHETTHAIMSVLSACTNKTCLSYDALQDRKNCMVELYGGYNLEQINEKVNGTMTAGENIGDLIGLKLAYRAYLEFAKDSEEHLLPGFNYTRRQWFWINYATFFCSHQNDATLKYLIVKDVHSPGEARVNVAFANNEDFSRDFACPSNTRMNATRRCTFE